MFGQSTNSLEIGGFSYTFVCNNAHPSTSNITGQQKVREQGSGALIKWQTKLRKRCKLGKRNRKRKIRKEKGERGKKRKGKRRGRGKEKDKGDKMFLQIIHTNVE